MYRLVLALACLGITGCTVGSCDYTASRDLDLDAAGLDSLVLMARAGELDIQGDAGLERIVVKGKACASSESYLEQTRLVERMEGGRLTLAVELPEVSGWGGSSWLDLELRVPARLALTISDTSGDTRIRNVASLEIEDSSGDLRIENVAAAVQVSDSSGDIDIHAIGGPVTVASDSSGDIEIAQVTGDVRIVDDSSGDISLREIAGDALVENDSSGDIRFIDIGGSARVGVDSSGSIDAKGVGGDFSVDRDGSGSIDHADVKGNVRIPADH